MGGAPPGAPPFLCGEGSLRKGSGRGKTRSVRGIGAFLFGVATGVLATLAAQRLRDFDWGENADKLRDRLLDHVEALEERIDGLDAAPG